MTKKEIKDFAKTLKIGTRIEIKTKAQVDFTGEFTWSDETGVEMVDDDVDRVLSLYENITNIEKL